MSEFQHGVFLSPSPLKVAADAECPMEGAVVARVPCDMDTPMTKPTNRTHDCGGSAAYCNAETLKAACRPHLHATARALPEP